MHISIYHSRPLIEHGPLCIVLPSPTPFPLPLPPTLIILHPHPANHSSARSRDTKRLLRRRPRLQSLRRSPVRRQHGHLPYLREHVRRHLRERGWSTWPRLCGAVSALLNTFQPLDIEFLARPYQIAPAYTSLFTLFPLASYLLLHRPFTHSHHSRPNSPSHQTSVTHDHLRLYSP